MRLTWMVMGLGLVLLAADAAYDWRLGESRSVLPAILRLGGALSLLAVVLLFTRIRAQREMRAHLQALESLHQVSTAISAQIGQGSAILQQVSDAARHLLHMPMSSILLLDGADHASVISGSGAAARLVGRRLPLDTVRVLQTCVTEKRMVCVSDIEDPQLDINRELLRPIKVRSVFAVPMQVGSRAIGALVVADDRPRTLREDEMRLARLWGAQAAVIIHNNDLYQRMESLLHEQQRAQEHRDLLLDLSLALYDHQTLETALGRMIERAPAVLGVDAMTFALMRGDTELNIIACTHRPDSPDLTGVRYPLEGTIAGEVMAGGRVVILEDVASEPRFNEVFRQSLDIGAVMFVPMCGSEGAPLGLMGLVRHQPGPFTEEQRQTAVYLADRSAAAIEVIRLHERARSDAETKTMLLRELHHRVKNNLAGIISLLSIGQPELPPDARQWLDRAIERIGVMARAHELFTGAAEALSLRELFRVTLSSLSVLVPPGMRIKVDAGEGDISLRPDRAVALAMVVHELAHNAIQHGTDTEGTLTLRWRVSGAQVRIEVMDAGRPESRFSDASPAGGEEAESTVDGAAAEQIGPESGTGLGLGLVNGLVKRELGGVFSLQSNPWGGITATLEFAVHA